MTVSAHSHGGVILSLSHYVFEVVELLNGVGFSVNCDMLLAFTCLGFDFLVTVIKLISTWFRFPYLMLMDKTSAREPIVVLGKF